MQGNTYKEAVKLEFPNSIIRVHHPDLTPAERNKRMNKIYKASADLLKECERKVTKK